MRTRRSKGIRIAQRGWKLACWVFQRSFTRIYEGFQVECARWGILEYGEIRCTGHEEQVGSANSMGMGTWLGSSATVIVMLSVFALSLAAFLFWIKRVQFGAARAFVAAVLPASTINVGIVLAFLLATPDGVREKDELLWFLATPLAVYAFASFVLCSVLLIIRGARGRVPDRIDSLTVLGTLTAYYAFLLILYPVVFCLYALMRPIPM